MSFVHPLRIGDLELENNLLMAPIAGFTNMPARLLARQFGCALAISEMISSMALWNKHPKTYKLLTADLTEKPLGIQLCGSRPEVMAATAYEVENLGADLVDINMGCPMRKVVNGGSGSALMKTPRLAGEIVKAVVEAVSVPVTVKIRLGWDNDSINAVEIAKIAEANGAVAVAVHGRTRTMLYSGKANWDEITKVKNSVSIPVIGNGDIRTPEDAKNCLENYGVDGIMIGRGSMGRPWLFQQIIDLSATGHVSPAPSGQEIKALLEQHYERVVEIYGESIGSSMMRKIACYYAKERPGARDFRNLLNRSCSIEEFKKIMREQSDELFSEN